MSDDDQGSPKPAPSTTSTPPAQPPPSEPDLLTRVGYHDDHVASTFQLLGEMVGATNVALGGKNELISFAGDLMTQNSSLYGEKEGTSLGAAAGRLVLDVTYDRTATEVALSTGAAAEAFTAGLTAGLYGTELGVPLGPAAPLVGLAVGVGTYLALSNEGVRRNFEDSTRSFAASIASAVSRTYGEATQRAGEAVYDLDRNVRNLYTTAPY